MKTFILAAGGTGGHVFPAIALAHALKSRGHNAILLTDKRIVKFASALGDTPRRIIHAGPLSPKGLLPLCLGILQAMLFILKAKPVAVIGFGGYPSFPGVAAAILLGKPLILHEQNSYMGKVNRWLSKFAEAVALSFPHTVNVPDEAQSRTHVTGNPVRPQIKRLYRAEYSRSEDTLYLLVTGGSQGSSIFAEVVPHALSLLPVFLKNKLVVTQQARADEVQKTQDFYQQHGIRAGVATFIDDMQVQLGRADIVICRSGASTVAELAVAGRPSILVPYPHAMEDHQTTNARWLSDMGAAILVPQDEFTAPVLANLLKGLLQSTEKRATMAEAAKNLALPDAEEVLADLVLKYAR